MRRFEGKAAIVTGAASGIGQAAARRFASEGAGVLLTDVNEAAGETAAAEIRDAGGDARFLRVDVRSAEDCARMVEEAVARWGGLDVLVNNAGVGEGAAVAAMDEATWDRVIDVNLKGVFLGSRAAFPRLAERRGCIVNTASVAGLVAAPFMGAYAASKGGVVQLTRVLALEGAKLGVRANAVCPVWIDTPMVEQYVGSTDDPRRTLRAMALYIPMGRLGTVEDVAAAIAFLASDEAGFITGVALPIDGGALCQ